MKSLQLIPVFIVVLIATVFLGNSLYTVNETEQFWARKCTEA